MSAVTNLICAYGLCANDLNNEKILEKINECCPAFGKLTHIDSNTLPDGWYANGKMAEANIAIGTFNHLDIDQWVKNIRETIPLIDAFECDYVQFIVSDDNSEGFGIINVLSTEQFNPFKGYS